MYQQDVFRGTVASICFIATVANRIMVFYCYGGGNELNITSNTLFWLCLTVAPDLLVLLILCLLLFRIGWIYPQFNPYSLVVGLSFAIFIILVSACNIFMLKITGRNIDWNIVFEVDFTATYSLYKSHISSFLHLLAVFIFLGITIWSIILRRIQAHKNLRSGYIHNIKTIAVCLILTYIMVVSVFELPQLYSNLSSNMVLAFIPKLVSYYSKEVFSRSMQMEQAVLNRVAEIVRAPTIDISRPLVTLKKPIKHVFVIVLESIRSDALPLNESLAKVAQATFTSEATAENITPLLHSLWKESVRTAASVMSSYTLKSLLSTFCGLYPLNVNFLKETKPGNVLYEKCLPELLRETFLTADNRSMFQSAFFTAARDDFDRQRELFKAMKFDTVKNGFDIYEEVGYQPDLGMFGPADPYILPLMWKWIDKSLVEQKSKHLMISLLTTGTHEPFAMPYDQPNSNYNYYTNEYHINNYLNALRVTDKLLKDIIDGFISRNLYRDTLFVITSDHGYVFRDHGRETLGLLSTPLESALTVPLILHNPYLEAKQLNGQFTTMDILPTIMDVLLSSIKSSEKSANQLMSVPHNELKLILSRYEGTSILRTPVEEQPVRYTFHLANPGNSYIIVKQYPKKLTYDIANDQVHLYHLGHDPLELIDLIALDQAIAAAHPSWIDVLCDKSRIQEWKGLWNKEEPRTIVYRKRLLENKTFVSVNKMTLMNNGNVRLKDMIEWGDQAFELARLWKILVKQRYHYEVNASDV